MAENSHLALAYEVIASHSRAITEPELAASLSVGRLAVPGIVADLMVR